jgi:hypothetical protein
VQDERRSFQVEHLLSLPRQLTHATAPLPHDCPELAAP